MSLPTVTEETARAIKDAFGDDLNFCPRAVELMQEQNPLLANNLLAMLNDLQNPSDRQIVYGFICTMYYALNRQLEVNEIRESIDGST